MSKIFIPPASRLNANVMVEDHSKEIKEINLILKRLDEAFYSKKPLLLNLKYNEQIFLYKFMRNSLLEQRKDLKEKIIFYKNYYRKETKSETHQN